MLEEVSRIFFCGLRLALAPVAVFYTKSVAALCRMILCEGDYLAQGRRMNRTSSNSLLDKRADVVSRIVSVHCLGAPNGQGQTVIEHLDGILKTDNYRDPGAPFTLRKEVNEQVRAHSWSKK